MSDGVLLVLAEVHQGQAHHLRDKGKVGSREAGKINVGHCISASVSS